METDLNSGIADFLSSKMAGEIPLLLVGTDGVCSQYTDELTEIISEREARFAPDPVLWYGTAKELASFVDVPLEERDD